MAVSHSTYSFFYNDSQVSITTLLHVNTMLEITVALSYCVFSNLSVCLWCEWLSIFLTLCLCGTHLISVQRRSVLSLVNTSLYWMWPPWDSVIQHCFRETASYTIWGTAVQCETQYWECFLHLLSNMHKWLVHYWVDTDGTKGNKGNGCFLDPPYAPDPAPIHYFKIYTVFTWDALKQVAEECYRDEAKSIQKQWSLDSMVMI